MATEATTICGVAVFGASADQAATIEATLGVLTEEQRGCVRAIHFADADGFLPNLGVPMPDPSEWGGAWAEHVPGAIGVLVFRGWLGSGQFSDALVHELAHLLLNFRVGEMARHFHDDAYAAVNLELYRTVHGE